MAGVVVRCVPGEGVIPFAPCVPLVVDWEEACVSDMTSQAITPTDTTPTADNPAINTARRGKPLCSAQGWCRTGGGVTGSYDRATGPGIIGGSETGYCVAGSVSCASSASVAVFAESVAKIVG